MKRFNEKLVLNKKTIANLEINELKEVQGGGTQFTCIPEICYRPTLWLCPTPPYSDQPTCIED